MPNRCFECPYCGIDRKLEYYPFYVCKKNGKEIHFCAENGWDKMKWCPMKEDEKDGE